MECLISLGEIIHFSGGMWSGQTEIFVAPWYAFFWVPQSDQLRGASGCSHFLPRALCSTVELTARSAKSFELDVAFMRIMFLSACSFLYNTMYITRGSRDFLFACAFIILSVHTPIYFVSGIYDLNFINCGVKCIIFETFSVFHESCEFNVSLH
jgi:hypothetical protein